jgi:F0F1-type ATP synthase assembly protein I
VRDPGGAGGGAKGPGRAGGGGRGPYAGSAEAYRFLGIGLTWVASTLLGAWLGSWLDGRLATAPWLTLLGLLVGTGGGFAYMYHQAVVIPRGRERLRRERESK